MIRTKMNKNYDTRDLRSFLRQAARSSGIQQSQWLLPTAEAGVEQRPIRTPVHTLQLSNPSSSSLSQVCPAEHPGVHQHPETTESLAGMAVVLRQIESHDAEARSRRVHMHKHRYHIMHNQSNSRPGPRLYLVTPNGKSKQQLIREMFNEMQRPQEEDRRQADGHRIHQHSLARHDEMYIELII